jgi:hypothetical protein
MAGSCGCVYDPSRSTEGKEFEWLSESQFIRKVCALWSYSAYKKQTSHSFNILLGIKIPFFIPLFYDEKLIADV